MDNISPNTKSIDELDGISTKITKTCTLIEILISSVTEFNEEFEEAQIDKCLLVRAEFADSFEISIPLIRKPEDKVKVPNPTKNVVAYFQNQTANASNKMRDTLILYASIIDEFSLDPVDTDTFNRFEEFYDLFSELFKSFR